MLAPSISNALTIDVEDYFQVSAFAPYIPRSEWDTRECHIERNIERVLEMLAVRGIHATFFVLGWVAERYPGMVRSIGRAGHELASHGYAHERANAQSPEAFFADVQLAKLLIEDLSDCPVLGYRAPSFSIDAANPWAFDALLRAGYRYSSSIYPVVHDHYGMPEAPRFAFGARSGLLEIPITAMRLMGHNYPCGGGGYFRLYPYALSHWMLAHVNTVDQQPCVFYFHPWEIDTDQPAVDGLNARTRFRHYLNLGRMQPRLEHLLDDFAWDRMDHIFLHNRHEHPNTH